jgi:shikimate dehydrogenase
MNVLNTESNSWTITAKTKITGIMGNPVDHSTTPVVYNATYQYSGVDFVHVAYQVDNDQVQEAVKSIRALNLKGMVVTMPHKRAVIPFVDEIDPMAKNIGAVQSIINENGKLVGYNFDAPGFMLPLKESGLQMDKKNIVLLGAGGAARAVSFALADQGANIVILNRKEELSWAIELSENISSLYGREVPALELNDDNLGKYLEQADSLVNATSVGFGPDSQDTPVPAKLLKKDLLVYDIVFSPLKTRLLVEAEEKGCKIIPGMYMTAGTAILFFEKITGCKAPEDFMTNKVRDVLKSREKN